MQPEHQLLLCGMHRKLVPTDFELHDNNVLNLKLNHFNPLLADHVKRYFLIDDQEIYCCVNSLSSLFFYVGKTSKLTQIETKR